MNDGLTRCILGRLREVLDMVRGSRGFTLIELMIAVVIVAILASVAYPSYQSYMRKGHRGAAQAFMMEVAQRQQSYFINSRSYATSLTALDFPADTLAGFPPDHPVKSRIAPYYTVGGVNLGVSAGPPPSFTLELTPISTSMQSDDGSLCLTNAGGRTRNCQSGGTEEAW